jgi:hypothetical protein
MNLAFTPETLAWHYLNEAVGCMQRRQFAEALRHLDGCLYLTPNDAHAHWNKAVSLLSLGNYRAGFTELEWRWKLFDHCWGLLDRDVGRVLQLPRWQGEDGKHLLLYHEQGFGDAIMMLRFLPVLRGKARKITLLTVAPLKRLAQEFEIDVIVALPDSLAAFDCRCALFDPMVILGYGVDDIPCAPYIEVSWQRKARRLGIAWSGHTQTLFSVENFLSHLNSDGYEIVALQPGAVPPMIEPLPPGDFRDLAGRMAGCQVIVSIDTAAANLAGAIGHPNAHVVLPYLKDWRWYSAAAWYPTLKLHQAQTPGNYTAPFAAINQALQCPGNAT